MNDDDTAHWLDQAAADYDDDLERVAHLGRRQRRYLDRLHKVDDPETDGIDDCDTRNAPSSNPTPLGA